MKPRSSAHCSTDTTVPPPPGRRNRRRVSAPPQTSPPTAQGAQISPGGGGPFHAAPTRGSSRCDESRARGSLDDLLARLVGLSLARDRSVATARKRVSKRWHPE